jgi:hypothetical protein
MAAAKKAPAKKAPAKKAAAKKHVPTTTSNKPKQPDGTKKHKA